MSRNGKLLLLQKEILPVDDVMNRINRVTMEDISRCIHRTFDEQALCAALVGSKDSLTLADKLKKHF